MKELEDGFVYTETSDQLKPSAMSRMTWKRPVPMDRLVVGDVGSARQRWRSGQPARRLGGKQVAILPDYAPCSTAL